MLQYSLRCANATANFGLFTSTRRVAAKFLTGCEKAHFSLATAFPFKAHQVRWSVSWRKNAVAAAIPHKSLRSFDASKVCLIICSRGDERA